MQSFYSRLNIQEIKLEKNYNVS